VDAPTNGESAYELERQRADLLMCGIDTIDVEAHLFVSDGVTFSQ
jgi:hypothetical protein